MKVKELIEFLQQLKNQQDAVVLLSSDEEGNSYSPVDIEHCGYAYGNFDKESNSPLTIKDVIYTMDEDEMHGKYIILYPRWKEW